MSYNISKELFEAVMKCKINNYGFGTSNIGIRVVTEMFDEILITYNDFFFKCKEWALEQGYILESSFKDTSICVVYRIINDGWSKTKETSFSRSSEQQAVFDACMYILNNKDRQ